jgi:hypothetical protein
MSKHSRICKRSFIKLFNESKQKKRSRKKTNVKDSREKEGQRKKDW